MASFGRIYEYLLMKFAMQGVQDNGEFFTPPSPVQTIVNIFDLLKRADLTKADREKVKAASQGLLASLRAKLAPLQSWTKKEQTQGEVESFILDYVYNNIPTPPFNDEEKQSIAKLTYNHIWQQSETGGVTSPPV